MREFFNELTLGNTANDWYLALAIILGCIIFLRIFQPKIIEVLSKWAARTTNDTDDFIVVLVKRSLLPALYFVALYIGLTYLSFSQQTWHRIEVLFMFIATFFVLRALTFTVQFLTIRFLRKNENSELKENHVRGNIPILNVMLWIAGAVFLLDNLGYNVTTVITGLGIGGIAIALAAQTILADLFSYFVILFDKPFEIGDYIVVDDKKGTIEYVGLKTTRLRSLSGEQIILSNTNLTNSRVHNFKRLQKRRIVFTIAVSNQTTPEALRSIPEMVREIIASHPDLQYDRGHFVSMAPNCSFEFVYFVNDPDFNIYMDRQQAINLRIMESFRNENINSIPLETLLPKEAGK